MIFVRINVFGNELTLYEFGNCEMYLYLSEQEVDSSAPSTAEI